MLYKSYNKSGLSLIEVTVVIMTTALLIALAVPSIRALMGSFQSQGSASSLISSALASARAIAATNQRYAGVRFQKAYSPDGPLRAPQYMIFIIQDPNIMAYGFRAVPGIEPVKLPETIGVMDLRVRTNPNPMYSGDEPVDQDGKIDQSNELQDTTTFSVLFSPGGKLLIHDVRVRNQQGVLKPATPAESSDKVFNSQENIVNYGIGRFVQDDYAELGLGKEASRNSFIIYEEQKLQQAYKRGKAWSAYLLQAAPQAVYINPYTGTLISPKQ